jgi:choline/glycine/proline betaine transport protein
MSTKEKPPRLAVNPPVFFTSVVLLVAFLGFGALFTGTARRVLPAVLEAISTHFGVLYSVAVAFFVGFCVWLLFSRHASVRLGKDDERPEFGTLTWFSMLFAAGMGIGLVFYGVAEPVMHYANPPTGDGRTAAAMAGALPTTYFHWGIHAWAIYALMSLGIAFFAYRRGLPLTIRSCFYPLLGERIFGLPGHVIDILAVFGTLFGLATSLGLGAMQISAGLSYLVDTPHSTGTQLVLIALVTAAATISLVTGVSKGIRRLSELNMLLASLLLLFVLLVGPTRLLVGAFVENFGRYLARLVPLTFHAASVGSSQDEWLRSWTIFYWGWWIAWAPFVGMFVARISRGRTVRELVLGVLLVPPAVTFLWLTVFGDTALYLELHGAGIVQAVTTDVSTAIYVMLEQLPLASITSLVAAVLVAVFFVTSSDSASFVVDLLTSGGHPNPPVWQRVFWATAEGACAAVLLHSGGEGTLKALQAGVVSIGLPFCLVLIALAFSIRRALREES